ncbi:MAG: tandem-95 repeat protein [Alphaproteobacteria bacterium]|nr:tandem-95 repeat protein [Alphaproteobacteria bacterium]
MEPLVVERRIAAGTDDAEEAASGTMYFDSSDLELVDDPEFNGNGQTVGLRFSGIGIPRGAVITAAYLQFQADQTDSSATALQIRGQAADNAAAFTATSGDLTSRATTSTAVPWAPAAWTTEGEAGLAQRTPDLTDLVQQIVDRPGWAPDNALAFLVSGTGERTAESYDANPNAAPLLRIEYAVPDDTTNTAPVANDDSATTQAGQAVTISVLSNDWELDGDDYLITALGAPANGQVGINVDGSITYTPNAGFTGTDTFTYTITDTGGLSDTATVTLTVEPAAPVVVEQRIASSADDAEEAASGTMYFDSSDLELVDDPDFNGTGQTVGLRFAGLGIPQGAVISSAYLQFQVDETDAGTVSLQIRGLAADNAAAFASTSGDLTSRTTLASVIAWAPAAWTTEGEAGLLQRTPDLTDLVQQIVNRSGWAPDNALAFLVSGTGERTAESFDGDPDAAPLLHVEYTLPVGPPNTAPVANDDNAATQAGQAVVISVLSNDWELDGDDYLITALGAPSNGQINVNADGSITYTPNAGFAGLDTFTYTITDTGGLSDTATVSVNVSPSSPGPVVVEQRIASSTDDVEEAASGTMYFDSSDLELVDDPDFNGTGQTVGLRFADLDIPQGAVITTAYVQFQVDETDGGAVSLQIRGQAADNAGAFTATSGDLTSRATTSSSISWSPDAWTTVGAAGAQQRTPDLAELIQQIVDRPGWAPSNAMAFVVSGSGERSAESYDGDASAAPLLHVEYVLPDPNNQAPTDIVFSNIQIITENQAGAIAATLSVIDPNPSDSHTYTLSDDRFEVVNNQLKLKDDARLDFEKGTQVSVDVTAIDTGGLRTTETIAISVEDVSETRFASVGDYAYGQAARDVADLIDSLNVDYIVTNGDNAYDDVPIDDNIGQFYADYIGNYQGSYGDGSPVNRFFPALGNHEYHDNSGGLNDGIDTYLDYFTLPGNERYYDFEIGPVQFFIVNSNFAEPDGVDANSVQAAWLQNGLAASTAAHKIVVFHHPSYSSGSHGDHPFMQWPFEEWGATAILNGHDHTYERILRDDNEDGVVLPYIVSGLGGRSISAFSGDTTEGSVAQYNDNYGALLVQASDTSVSFEFISVGNGGTIIDEYTFDVPGTSNAQAQVALAFSEPELPTVLELTIQTEDDFDFI